MQYQIDRKCKVELGGVKQKIHVRGTDAANPLLLFLHGGPGISNRSGVMEKHSDLCDAFTIVAWDQRGTGGSYFGVSDESLTVDQLVADAKQLVEWLCAEYGKQKVLLLGGSWGTQLGTLLSHRHPQHVGAYVGYGQVVNGIENERISYEYTLKKAEEAADTEAIETLKQVGPPVNGQYKPCFEGLMKQRSLMKKYGGHSMKKGTYWSDTVKPILLSSEYSLADKYGMAKGYKKVLSAMWPTMPYYNFVTECNTFEVPYYIFQGVHDNNTPSALVQEFYDAITAPDKDLVWFENSAHGPLGEEPEKFKALLREKLLPLGC